MRFFLHECDFAGQIFDSFDSLIYNITQMLMNHIDNLLKVFLVHLSEI